MTRAPCRLGLGALPLSEWRARKQINKGLTTTCAHLSLTRQTKQKQPSVAETPKKTFLGVSPPVRSAAVNPLSHQLSSSLAGTRASAALASMREALGGGGGGGGGGSSSGVQACRPPAAAPAACPLPVPAPPPTSHSGSLARGTGGTAPRWPALASLPEHPPASMPAPPLDPKQQEEQQQQEPAADDPPSSDDDAGRVAYAADDLDHHHAAIVPPDDDEDEERVADDGSSTSEDDDDAPFEFEN